MGERTQKWEEWQEAIVPKSFVKKNSNRYTQQSDHHYNNGTLQALATGCPGNCCGIYEMKVKRNDEEAVVYIGSSCRKERKSLYERIREYLTHGSHIKQIVQRYLDRGFQVWVRWMQISADLFQTSDDGKSLAEELELS